jgi:hypothetical protein
MWSDDAPGHIAKRDEDVFTLSFYINTVQDFLLKKNLHYKNMTGTSARGNNRIIFDVHTEEYYTVHVDTIPSKCTVDQLLDCLYGSGSESDHKLIIYRGDNEKCMGDYDYPDLKEFSPEEYFVSLMVEQCDNAGVPFSIIEFSHIIEGLMWGPRFSDRQEYKSTGKSLGRLPSKQDIQRMAFWALYFNPHRKEKYNLEDLHCTESMEFKILNDLCVLAKWDEEGISYVVADNQQSEFIRWLWSRRCQYLEKYTSFRSSSFYRDGRQSRICLPGDGIPIHKINDMSKYELRDLGIHLYTGVKKLRSEIVKIWNERNGISQHIEEEREGTLISDIDFE